MIVNDDEGDERYSHSVRLITTISQSVDHTIKINVEREKERGCGCQQPSQAKSQSDDHYHHHDDDSHLPCLHRYFVIIRLSFGLVSLCVCVC